MRIFKGYRLCHRPQRETPNRKFVNKFKELMDTGKSTTEDSLSLGLDFLANTRIASDSLADVFFTDTEISYRDDNRIM